MTVRPLLLRSALGAAILVCAAPGAAQTPAAPAGGGAEGPLNVVLILADDLGWADLGVYGSAFHETPNLDRLAARGLRFTDAYAASTVCSPTRTSLMTGRHPARVHQTDWIPGQGEEKGAPLLQVRDLDHLPLAEVTVAEMFRSAGYRTAHIGKWHLGGEGHLPQDQGFDVNIGGSHWGAPGSYFYPYRSGNRSIPELEAGGRPGEYLTDRIAEEAAGFIQASRSGPFFLYLPLYAVHTPIQGKPELVKKYEAKARALGIGEGRVVEEKNGLRTRVVQSNPGYAAMVETMDHAVGRVLRALEENGVADRTIVVFTSDNGGLSVLTRDRSLPPTSSLPLRGGKGWVYEGGIRVPMIVHWPGVTRPGRTAAPVTTSDVLPTLVAAAGLPAPSGTLDGESLLPLLKGSNGPGARPLFWHYPHYHGSGSRPSGAVRDGHLKLVEWYETGAVELYDLASDPGESSNLAAQRPTEAARLRRLLARWRDEVGAQMPAANPEYPRAARGMAPRATPRRQP